ncbi:protein NO VEIN domain-containing protein [Amycolatopsis sp. CB00013]|uniref:protein NO VEIN domain-containing protein n=1 Tax=Amycolatopsis sp. CB00013 TaxID=1703945 RepID=UPI0013014685|nr:DUF3883 domain-containing protein [Amycolatopsis sp. CB00013]
MAINDWWAGDDNERFWMEITDRSDLGDDLNAPTLNGAGREEWGYTLVTETRPGDIVLHWHRTLLRQPALVGWSTVVGPLAIEEHYTWTAHGTRGRERARPTTGQGWRMPCTGFQRLAQPVDKRRLIELEPQLLQVHERLSQRVRGALYFPFMFYRPGEVRAAQTYLTKFPAALVDLLPELSTLRAPKSIDTPPTRSAGNKRSGGAYRRLQDPELRRVIELHAVRLATQHYLDQGATEVEELGKPYDLRVLGLGPERHVEVKGSSVDAIAIELTANEIAHAHNHKPTDLVVVDRIETRRRDDGGYDATGGHLRIWEDWEPDQQRLAPTQYRYPL